MNLKETVNKLKKQIIKESRKTGMTVTAEKLGIDLADLSRFVNGRMEWSWEKIYKTWKKLGLNKKDVS